MVMVKLHRVVLFRMYSHVRVAECSLLTKLRQFPMLNENQDDSVRFRFKKKLFSIVVYFDQRLGAAHAKCWSK